MILDVHEFHLRLAARDGYAVHQALAALLDAGSGNRLLTYRAERMDDGHYVVLARLRDPSHDCADLPTTHTRLSLTAGDTHTFTLTLNAVSRYNGRTTHVLRDWDVADWLHARSEPLGFTAEIDSAFSKPVVMYKRRERITVSSALLCGRLTIRDEAKFAAAYLDGVGRKRGLGFGLIELAT